MCSATTAPHPAHRPGTQPKRLHHFGPRILLNLGCFRWPLSRKGAGRRWALPFMGLPGKYWGSVEQPPLLVACLFFNLGRLFFNFASSFSDWALSMTLGHNQFGALHAFGYIERIAPLERKRLKLFVGGWRDSLNSLGLAWFILIDFLPYILKFVARAAIKRTGHQQELAIIGARRHKASSPSPFQEAASYLLGGLVRWDDIL